MSMGGGRSVPSLRVMCWASSGVKRQHDRWAHSPSTLRVRAPSTLPHTAQGVWQRCGKKKGEGLEAGYCMWAREGWG